MNKYQKILSPFLGGVLGILLSGYAYYMTNEQSYWLLPLGVLVGSSIGYFIGDMRTVMTTFVSKIKLKLQKFREIISIITFALTTLKDKFILRNLGKINLEDSKKLRSILNGAFFVVAR